MNCSTESGSFQRSCIASQSNLLRMRFFPLGHSDPQIYTFTQSHQNSGGFSSNRYLSAYNARRTLICTSPKAKFRVSFPFDLKQDCRIIFCFRRALLLQVH